MNITRRIHTALLALAMLLTLAACSSSAGRTEAPTKPSAGLANPVKPVTAEELTQAVGVAMYAPSNAENVSYQTITALDTVIGQMCFILDGREYTCRVTTAELDVTQLSGMYFTAAAESYAQVSYAEGMILTEGTTSVLYWEDIVPGVRYSLACTDCEDPSILLDIAEETFVPAQGEAGGSELPAEASSLEGIWVDTDGSTVELTAAGVQEFAAVIGIFRLAEFIGTGVPDAGTVNLTLEAPDGSELSAVFCLEEDGTARLVIAQSHWELLDSGTQFSGFVKQ